MKKINYSKVVEASLKKQDVSKRHEARINKFWERIVHEARIVALHVPLTELVEGHNFIWLVLNGRKVRFWILPSDGVFQWDYAREHDASPERSRRLCPTYAKYGGYGCNDDWVVFTRGSARQAMANAIEWLYSK